MHLAWNEALSGVFGSISLASWVFLLVPQLVENYRSQSADGISLAFLAVWFVGDLANLVGAVWAGLVPTVIALAVYFCFADAVLISQCVYYNLVNARKERRQDPCVFEPAVDDPSQPLLRRGSSDSMGLPGSRRRSSASYRGRASGVQDALPSIKEGESTSREWLTNTASIISVCVVGAAGWAIAWRLGVWKATPSNNGPSDANAAIGAAVLGYMSAVCYLGARIPQIVKNYKESSCEGLALLFFILSLLGNTTYGAGILFHSVEKRYVLTNLPWLIGSLGTIGEDTLIFIQFHMYSKKDATEESSAIE